MKHNTYELNISVLTFRSGDVIMAYCPSLDVADYGDTAEDALANLEVTLQMHMTGCEEKGTLAEDLIAHGWTVKNGVAYEPTFGDIIKRPEVLDIVKSKTVYTRRFANLRIPAIV